MQSKWYQIYHKKRYLCESWNKKSTAFFDLSREHTCWATQNFGYSVHLHKGSQKQQVLILRQQIWVSKFRNMESTSKEKEVYMKYLE